MIEVFYLILGLALAAGLMLLKPVFFKVSKSALGTLNSILSNEPEAQKLASLQKSTKVLILDLVKVLLGAAVLGFSLLGLTFLYGTLSGVSWREISVWSFKPLLLISLGTVPLFLPRRRTSIGYSAVSKLLHELILPNYHVHKKLARFLDRFSKKNEPATRSDFLVVTGLARSGTTALLNTLYQHKNLNSLTYRHMPLLLSSSFWHNLNKAKSQKKSERSHKDGIMINVDSPEAFDEYFFKVELNDSYITDTGLYEHEMSKAVFENYLEYQAGVRKTPENIYLTKNNNFILHYHSLKSYATDFTVVVLIRDPLSHCSSLLEKHQQYSESNKDEFEKAYMGWLGHHEFGLNHKPFAFNDAKYALDRSEAFSMNYWLKNWVNYYTYVERFLDHALLVSYDDFCQKPNKVCGVILERFGLRLELDLKTHINHRKIDTQGCSESLLEEANKLHKQLLDAHSVNFS